MQIFIDREVLHFTHYVFSVCSTYMQLWAELHVARQAQWGLTFTGENHLMLSSPTNSSLQMPASLFLACFSMHGCLQDQ